MPIPFILGAAIAFIINVPMRAIEKFLFPKTRRPRLIKARRPLALVFTIIAVLGVLFLAVVVVIPQITGTITDVGRALPGAIEENWNKIEKLLEDQPRILEFLKNVRISYLFVLTNSLFGCIIWNVKRLATANTKI